jgi:hypothetical protein
MFDKLQNVDQDAGVQKFTLKLLHFTNHKENKQKIQEKMPTLIAYMDHMTTRRTNY